MVFKKGQHSSPSTEFKKGHISDNKGKTYEELYGKEKAEKKNKQMVETRMKNGSYIAWNKGKKGSQVAWNKGKRGLQILKLARAKRILPVKDTKIEIKIQNFLKQLGIDFFTHQYIKEIEHSYQCDILIPAMNLIIECDGEFTHCNPARYPPEFVRFPNGKKIITAKEIWERDKIRTEELIQKGFKVLRLWEFEINEISIKNFKEKINSNI